MSKLVAVDRRQEAAMHGRNRSGESVAAILYQTKADFAHPSALIKVLQHRHSVVFLNVVFAVHHCKATAGPKVLVDFKTLRVFV